MMRRLISLVTVVQDAICPVSQDVALTTKIFIAL